MVEYGKLCTRRTTAYLLLGLILLLASVLRLRGLDSPALWWDEGNNAYFALQSPSQLATMSRLTHDTNPPAHRIALGLWLRLLGHSAYNLRLLSVVCGLLTVLLVFFWGRWLGGPSVGLLAALFTAISPMAVYYSREAKGYPFVTLFTSLALYIWARYLDRPTKSRPLLWIVYILAQALALGAHYYALFAIGAQALWLVISLATTHPERSEARRRVRNCLIAQVATAAILLPWVLLTLARALDGAQHMPSDRGATLALPSYLKIVFFHLAAGPHTPDWGAGLALAILGIATACAGGLRRQHYTRLSGPGGEHSPKDVLFSMFLFPLGAGFCVQRFIPFFAPRFFLYVTPAFYLLAASGVVRLRKAGLALALCLSVIWGLALPWAYTPFVGAEEDLRPLAQSLRDRVRPGDGIVVGYVWQEGILRMYAPSVSARYHLGWFDRETVGEQVEDLFAMHPRLWLVTYRVPCQHPSNPAGWWLEHHAARAMIAEYGYNRAVLYTPPCADTFSASQTITFEKGIELRYSPCTEQVTAGEPIPLALQWRVNAPLSPRYAVFVHLLDGANKLRAQSDGEPQNGLKPFPQFAVDELVMDCRAVLTPHDLPSGEYTLTVGLYHPETGERLQVLEGASQGADRCTIGVVTILSDGA